MERIATFMLIYFVGVVVCPDFYIGMFKKDDYLVAQDRLYKDRIPYRLQYAKYGRMFKCPITYIRVVDRLGYGGGPLTKIIRGGLKKKYVVLRLSAFNKPISVNIYVGCENKRRFTKRTTKKTTPTAAPSDSKNDRSNNGDANGSDTNASGSADNGSSAGGDGETTTPAPEEAA